MLKRHEFFFKAFGEIPNFYKHRDNADVCKEALMKNLLVVQILNNIADILEMQDVQFKPQAYRKAAMAIESLPEDIEQAAKEGKLQDIPGVGGSIAEKIEEIVKTGKLKYYEKLKKQVPVNLEELNAIPGLGPKKIKALYKQLKVKNLKDLEAALKKGKVQQLEGFGEETAKSLLQGIEVLRKRPKRFLYAQAAPIVADILEHFGRFPFVKKIEIAGSFRRGKETVGDLDFLLISKEAEKVMHAFTSMRGVKKVIAHGTTRSSVLLENGMQVDIRVLHEKEWGSAQLYFIGSKEHNVELRKLCLKKGYTLSEYGLFTLKGKTYNGKIPQGKTDQGKNSGKTSHGRKWIVGKTQEEIYKKLGMRYIEPELRENTGEIEASLQKKLPALVEVKDINGVFHNHSTWSDGAESLLAMAQKAEQLGLKFISFNDHYGHMGITRPLNEKRLKGYLKEIEQVREKVKIRVFAGVEIDILKDGTLPLSQEKLKQLDVVIASVHMSQKMPEAEMTKRVCRALEEYPVNILGHPTGRLLNAREPIELNMEKVFEVARKRNVFLEINSQPARMDLNGELVKAGKEAGCKFALSTDAHHTEGLSFYPYGVLMARRGWLEKKDLLNCWSLERMEKALRK